MNEEKDELAATYALGIHRGSARAEIKARLGIDAVLQARAQFWQNELMVLDFAAQPEAPPPELFEKIVGKISAEEPQIPGTFTLRAGSGTWTEIAPGVSCTVLCEDPIAKRRSILLRAQPGAVYPSHLHEGYEECLVLEGDVVMGDLRLLPGDFHLATCGSAHPEATTVSGCLVYLSSPL